MRPPLPRLLRTRVLFSEFSPASPNIHFLQFDPASLVPELVHDNKENKHWQQDVVDHEIGGTKRVKEARVSLEEDEEDVCSQGEISSIRI